MKYVFTLTRYKNDVLDYSTDDVNDYPTKAAAVDAARYHAEYWEIIHHGKKELTPNGATVSFRSGNDRYLTRYEVK